MGRFVTRDPLHGSPLKPQSLNRYAYCTNNPLKFTDPAGLQGRAWDDDERKEAMGDYRDSKRKSRAKEHTSSSKFYFPGSGGRPDVFSTGTGQFILLVTPIFYNKDKSMGVAVGCAVTPVNSRFTSDSYAVHDYGFLIFFFDKDGNITDIIFIPFKDFEEDMGGTFKWIRQLLKEKGVSERDFEDALEKLTNYMDTIVDKSSKRGGVCIVLGVGLLKAPDPFSKIGSIVLIGAGAIFYVESWRWDRWRDILEELEDAID